VFEVRIHGRGGQGVVTAAELLSAAAFEEGRHAQAFPSFGSERTGAPVVSFCRVSDRPIRTREPVARPHAVVVQDATLIHQVDVLAGLREDGFVLVNSSGDLAALGLGHLAAGRPGRALAVDATAIARRLVGRPLPNAALLGALAAQTGLVHLDSVAAALSGRFPPAVAEPNIAAAAEAHRLVRDLMREASGARAG
jgi:pyruvate ferredoxin oxidoreductase gamma subunit